MSSHPIQYQAPLLKALAKEMDLHVYFAHKPSAYEQGQAGYEIPFDWDIDLLDGYNFTFLNNISNKPSVNNFWGCDTPEIKNIIVKERFDCFIVFGWNLKSYWQAVFACREKKIPILIRGDSHLLTYRSSIKRILKKLCYPYLLRQFDGFFVVGKRNRDYLKYYGVSEKQMFDCPHCVDNERFRRESFMNPSERRIFRRQLGLDEEQITCIFVGKLIPEKRPMDLIHALKILQDQNISIQLVMVGSGALEKELIAESKKLGVKATFAGFINQSMLPKYYAIADVLAVPSQGETWGLVVNEAMACGVPCIVTDACGCAPDLIENEVTGISYPQGDINALARALQTFISVLSTKDIQPAIQRKLSRYSLSSSVNGITQAALYYANKKQ